MHQREADKKSHLSVPRKIASQDLYRPLKMTTSSFLDIFLEWVSKPECFHTQPIPQKSNSGTFQKAPACYILMRNHGLVSSQLTQKRWELMGHYYPSRGLRHPMCQVLRQGPVLGKNLMWVLWALLYLTESDLTLDIWVYVWYQATDCI